MEDEFANTVNQSQLQFYYSALGLRYLVLLLLAAVIGFVVTLIVVIRGRGHLATAALLLAVLLPLLVGVEATVDGAMAASEVIAASGATPKPSEIARAVSMSLASLKVAMSLTAPIIIMAVVGSLLRSLTNKPT